jgi:hypothetical protein
MKNDIIKDILKILQKSSPTIFKKTLDFYIKDVNLPHYDCSKNKLIKIYGDENCFKWGA